MNIIEPLQIESGPYKGRWHMTVRSDESEAPARAVGACAAGCDGHETAAGAMAHYRQHLADHAVLRPLDTPPCDVPDCVRPQSFEATFPGRPLSVRVCRDHADREGVLAALRGRDVSVAH